VVIIADDASNRPIVSYPAGIFGNGPAKSATQGRTVSACDGDGWIGTEREGRRRDNPAARFSVATEVGALLAQGYDAHLVVHPDAHNHVGWRDAFDPALVDLLATVWE